MTRGVPEKVRQWAKVAKMRMTVCNFTHKTRVKMRYGGRGGRFTHKKPLTLRVLRVTTSNGFQTLRKLRVYFYAHESIGRKCNGRYENQRLRRVQGIVIFKRLAQSVNRLILFEIRNRAVRLFPKA